MLAICDCILTVCFPWSACNSWVKENRKRGRERVKENKKRECQGDEEGERERELVSGRADKGQWY